jgi:hypothetical protein
MKIEPVGHALITKDAAGKKVQRLPGKPFEIDDAEAKRLIAAGYAKAAGGESASAPPVNEKSKEAKK